MKAAPKAVLQQVEWTSRPCSVNGNPHVKMSMMTLGVRGRRADQEPMTIQDGVMIALALARAGAT